MSAYAVPALAAIFLWWASTGVILGLVRLPRSLAVATVAVGALLLGLGLYGIAATAGDTSIAGAYWAFGSALAVWAWIEVTFLLGFITGPRREACPSGCGGPAHFRHSVEAVIYHEAVLVAGVVLLLFLTADAPNTIGSETFLALWIMRLSAKLNLYLGVRNRGEQFLPPHLAYLESFFGRRTHNALLPVAMLGMALWAAWLVAGIIDPAASAFTITGDTLVATLVLLGLLEHAFMVLPLRSERLWQWRTDDSAAAGEDRGLPAACAKPAVAGLAPPAGEIRVTVGPTQKNSRGYVP